MKEKATEKILIRLTETEKRYAIALSKRCGKCLRNKIGSVAHGLKWALRNYAKNEGLKIFEDVYTSHNN